MTADLKALLERARDAAALLLDPRVDGFDGRGCLSTSIIIASADATRDLCNNASALLDEIAHSERVNFDNEDERAMACNLWHAMLSTPIPSSRREGL